MYAAHWLTPRPSANLPDVARPFSHSPCDRPTHSPTWVSATRNEWRSWSLLPPTGSPWSLFIPGHLPTGKITPPFLFSNLCRQQNRHLRSDIGSRYRHRSARLGRGRFLAVGNVEFQRCRHRGSIRHPRHIPPPGRGPGIASQRYSPLLTNTLRRLPHSR